MTVDSREMLVQCPEAPVKLVGGSNLPRDIGAKLNAVAPWPRRVGGIRWLKTLMIRIGCGRLG